jgi:hypothetical protein
MTPNPSSSDTDSAFDQLVAGFNEIHRHQAHDRDLSRRCDFCSGEITPDDRVTVYVSDIELGGYIRPIPGTSLYAHRMYCQACDRQHIVYPHEGTSEFLFASTLQPDGTHSHWTVRDTAPASEGEPWTAPEAVELIYGLPLDILGPVAAHDNHSFSHEDLVDTLRSHRIGIREVFDEGGNIVASPTTQDQIREQIHDELATLAGTVEDADDTDEFHSIGHEQIAAHGRDRPEAFTCPECNATAPTWSQLEHEPSCTSLTE